MMDRLKQTYWQISRDSSGSKKHCAFEFLARFGRIASIFRELQMHVKMGSAPPYIRRGNRCPIND
jgi:hypothetical protein